MAIANALPRWDLTPFYPGLDSSEFLGAQSLVDEKLSSLEALFGEFGIDKKSAKAAIEPDSFHTIVAGFEAVQELFSMLRAYVEGFSSVDSRNELALAKSSELNQAGARLGKLRKRLTAWVGSSDTTALRKTSECAKDRAFFIERSETAAAHQMSPDMEGLLSDLEVTGSNAWERLYDNLTSQLEGDVPVKGRLPVSAIRTLAYDPDRDVRRSAYEAELGVWKGAEVPIAAAMNAIKGETLEVCKRRGWDSPLDAALFGTHIDRQTLDAMLGAARAAFPDFRRYMRLKAKALGIGNLAFYDLFAPLPGLEGNWHYEEAERFVSKQFHGYSVRLGEFADRAFGERWIDAEPRPGKVGGAFCMRVRADESRILMNFSSSYGSLSTLAHELGHGYHNVCLKDRKPLQRGTPMTLAETASIFCETIVRRAAIENGSREEKLQVLEASLQGACQTVVDITSRFDFESAVYQGRLRRELSPRELCDLMLEAQQGTYGDALSLYHPYMWAAKPHYYGSTYYNFPYMFGLLFGLGLYSIYLREPETFLPRYDDLLSSTGLADAATLAATFGIDIRSGKFWDSSFDQLRSDIDLLETLVI